MDDAEHIKALELKLLQLDAELQATREKLYAVYNELQQLKKGTSTAAATLPQEGSPKIKENLSFENFVGLRLIHLVGIVVLVIGLSIGVKYAIDKNLISEVARVILAYAAGLVLYFLSVRLKKDYHLFSGILFSGAMASLYFTTYGAFVYYSIMPFAAAFAFMIVLIIFTVYQAISYNRQEIALLGLVGAYAIPFLISQNNDKVELFFLYILLINTAVVFLYVRKRWVGVGRAAFFITWILFFGWAAIRYQPEKQWISFLFMTAFYFLFLFQAISLKLVYRQSFEKNDALLILLNHSALYLSAIILFSSGLAERAMTFITIVFLLFTAIGAITSYLLWKEEKYLNRLLWGASVFLLIYFISLQWDGLTVTLLF